MNGLDVNNLLFVTMDNNLTNCSLLLDQCKITICKIFFVFRIVNRLYYLNLLRSGTCHSLERSNIKTVPFPIPSSKLKERYFS